MLRASSLSLLLHILLFLMFIIAWHEEQPKVGFNNKMQAYIVIKQPALPSQQVLPQKIKTLKPRLPISKKGKKQHRKKIEKAVVTQTKSTPQHYQARQQLSRGQYDALRLILHKKIQAHQQYPDNLPLTIGEREVRVGFMLTPEGKVYDVKILRGSGVNQLDLTVLASLASLPVVTQARQYIKHSHYFTITIKFQ